jgi:hypothetical protein
MNANYDLRDGMDSKRAHVTRVELLTYPGTA